MDPAASAADPPAIGTAILASSSPLGDAADLDPLLERIGDARLVLIGEASTAPTTTTAGEPSSPAA